MNFGKHLFLSYAHVDDLPTPGDDHGWVTRFHRYLETYLSQSIGEEAKIWRDDRLRGNDIFANEIAKQFPETAILLSILSPRYIDSEWCLREVDEFCRSAESHGGLTVEDKARVFRVMLKRIPTERREQLPNILRDALGYEFYESDGTRELPLDPSFGTGETYRRQIYFLAQDIAELITKLKQKEVDQKEERGAAKPNVYLAECSYDLREERDRIRGELRAHGYKVLPDQMAQLPELESEYIAEATRLLESCQVSVHLISGSRGKLPDGVGSKSAVQLQNEVAADLSARSGLRRLIWLPEGTRSEQPDHQAFIDALLRVPVLQQGADLITTNIETFKAAIHSMLCRLEVSIPHSEPNDSQPLVHVICDQRDRSATIPLRKYLKSQCLEVAIPVFEGNAMQVRQANEDFLRRSDVVIVFYGAGDEAWKHAVENDLRRAAAFREDRPLLHRFMFLVPPSTEDKQEIVELGDSYVVNALSGFNESDLNPVLDLLRSR
jgi:TIR domain